MNLFLGDSRANENMALTSIHTIFIRLHNQLAMNLSEINPHWSDDLIYYETRHIVSALLQHITYEEFLPLLIGRRLSNFGPYQYNSSVKFHDPLKSKSIVQLIE